MSVVIGKTTLEKEMIVKASAVSRAMQSGEKQTTVNLVTEAGLRLAVRDTDLFFNTAKFMRPGDFISCEADSVSTRSWKPNPEEDRTIELKYLTGIHNLKAERGEWSDTPPEEFADREPLAVVEATSTFAPPVKGAGQFQAPAPDTAAAAGAGAVAGAEKQF